MKTKLRKGREDDLQEILRLNKKLADLHAKTSDYFLPGSETREPVSDWLESVFEAENTRALVAEKGSRLGGYFIGMIEETKPFIKPAREGRISDAYLEPELRGKGVTGRAMEQFTAWFKDKGINSIRLSVHSKNEEAIQA